MKANRSAIYNDEEAVSPVIAVILMVAITVVLAATVFVLVNELGQNVGTTGPSLGLTTASGPTGPAIWEIRVTSATQALAIAEYNLVLSAPGGSANVEWADGANDLVIGSDCYQITKAPDGGNLAVGDRFRVEFEAGAACLAVGDDFPSGVHELELIHRTTGTTAGSLSRTF